MPGFRRNREVTERAEDPTAPHGRPQPSVLPDRGLRLAPDRAGGGARGARLLRPGPEPAVALARPRARQALDRSRGSRLTDRALADRASRAGPRPRRHGMKKLVETVVRRLADHPDQARV